MSTPDEALQKYIGDLGGVESNAWHDAPVDQVFKDGFAAGRQSEIDAANAQEPELFVAYGDSNGSVVLELFGFDEKECKNKILNLARSEGYKGTLSGYLMRKSWEVRPLYARPIPAQQSPAVAVPEVSAHIWYDQNHERYECSVCNGSAREKSEITHLDECFTPSPRITEQDALPAGYREEWKRNVMLMWSCVRKHDSSIPSDVLDYMREQLLAKLNEAKHD